MVCMYHSFLIHSSADGHLGCFHVLAIINSAHFWAYTSRKPDQKETRAQSCQGVRDLRDLRGSPLLHLCDICWDIMSTTSEVSAQTAHKAEGQTGMVTLGSRVWGFSLLWLMSDCLFFHVVSEVFPHMVSLAGWSLVWLHSSQKLLPGTLPASYWLQKIRGPAQMQGGADTPGMNTSRHGSLVATNESAGWTFKSCLLGLLALHPRPNFYASINCHYLLYL